jgi:hypothetical protein
VKGKVWFRMVVGVRGESVWCLVSVIKNIGEKEEEY